MFELLQCSRGHQWRGEAGPAGAVTCPECGAVGETVRGGITPATAGGTAAGAGAELPDLPGYDLLRVIGKGGMGVVYHARHLALNREVALKVVLAAEHAQPQELVRFLAEAETVARLQHPHIVPVYDVGQAHGRPYFTMELVTGGTLKQRLERGPLSDREAAELLLKLARTAEHAHAHGIVHRDLKPENVLLTEGGEPRITDFGVAKRLAGGRGLTQTGAVLGTPAYMAPEQAAGSREVGPAADVYALGVILYECLTGRSPFAGDSVYDTLHKVLTEDAVSPAWFRPSVSRDLETVCLKCLRKKPEQRYAGAGELADDLERYLRHRPIKARRTARWERALKCARRHPAAAAVLLLLALLAAGAAAAGGWYYDRFVRVHVAYYANWTKRWGAYEGLGPLTPEQVGQRPYSYKFYTRAGRVERVDVVGADGGLSNQNPAVLYMDSVLRVNPPSRPERYYKFERDADGRVTDEVAYDRHDRLVWRLHYTSPTTAAFTDADGIPMARQGTGATFVEFQRDADGLETELHYRDKDNRPRPDADGAYGWRLEYDARGNVTRLTFLDARGQPFRTNSGFAAVEFSDFTDFGLAREVRYFDEAGQPTRHKDGYASLRRTYDDAGRLVEETNLDEAGRPVRSLGTGSFRWRTTYAGPEDFVVESLDEQYRLVPDASEAARLKVETVRATPAGRTVKVTNFDESGRAVRGGTWVAGWVAVNDPDGRPLEKSYFGPDGKPTFCKEGYAREVMAYNERGDMVSWEGFDAEGRPARNNAGYARMTCAYDGRGRRTEEAYFDPAGRPTPHKNGYARKVMHYDSDVRVTAEEYFDAEGRPVRCRDGYARVTFAHDLGGHVIEASYFGPDGRPTWHKKGYAVLRRTYDPRGNVLTRTALAPDGRPVVDHDGLCEVRTEYDPWGRPTRVSYFGPDGRPAPGPDGAASVERSFDRFGNPLVVSYFGADGERVCCKEGYWQQRMEYDAAGWLRRSTYHDIDGVQRAAADNVAESRRQVDGRGNPVEFLYLGADGKPALRDGLHARVAQVFDDRSLLREESYFGPDLERPAKASNGSAGSRAEYDARGRQTSRTYVGPDGKPWRHADGYAQLRWAYDDRGRWVEEAYFDEQGRPAATGGSVASTRRAYDDRGNPTEQTYHDRDGKLVAGSGSYARVVSTYDERDNKTSQSYLGPDGRPCLHCEGNARVTWRYDDRDQLVEHAFYGPDGRLKLLPKYGYARQTMSYDGHGNPLVGEYFDADDRPMNGPDGYARCVASYDDAGRRTGTAYFDRDGRRLKTHVVVMKVHPGGQGDKLGLKPGDLLTHYDGKDVIDTAAFIKGRNAEKPGGPKKLLRVLRDGKASELSVAPGRMQVELRDRFVPDPGAAGKGPSNESK